MNAARSAIESNCYEVADVIDLPDGRFTVRPLSLEESAARGNGSLPDGARMLTTEEAKNLEGYLENRAGGIH